MANTDKNIVITPNNGSASDPNIVFSGANASTGAQNITLTVTPNNSGTVAFSGSAGQLLTINNDIANTLSTAGTISATGNITGNNFVGNLIGNVTGNFSGSLANGNSNVSIPAANGNVNISAVGVANIVVVTGTGANITGTLSVSGNANVGNIGATNGVFTNVSGNGSSLTSITGANVTGQVGNALVAGTVYTNAQPNITSIGTLTSLSVSGNANVGNIGATNGVFTNVSGNGSSLSSITGANVTGQVSNTLVSGTVYTNAQPNITSVGTLTTLSVSGNANVGNIGATNGVFTNVSGNGSSLSSITGANVTGQVANALVSGTVYTNAQPNITSVGTLTSLSTSGNANVGNLGTAGLITATGNITGNYILGNGSQLTGIVPSVLSNGNSNVSIPAANGNVNISVAGQANRLVVTGTGANITGTLRVSGNANVGNLGTTNLSVTGDSTLAGVDAIDVALIGNLDLILDTANQKINKVNGELIITASASQPDYNGSIYLEPDPTYGLVQVTGPLSVTGVISGNGSSLSSITGANVTGQVGNALVAGTVYTAAQPNITSVGTLTGLTLSGNVNMGTKNITTLADPVSAQDAATKNYVDTTAQGLDPKASVVYATTTTIFGSGYTYNNGTSGVGATITSSTNGAISIDGSTPTASDRVLIKNEAGAFVNNTTQSAAFNGIYIVTQVGSGALPFILTRALDFDNGSPSGEIPGAFTFVEAGTTNADTGWVCTTNAPVTMGTTQIVFTQFSGAGTYSAGTGLTLTGTVFSVNASQTQVTQVGTLTTLSVSGNANVGNIGATNGVFTNVSGNGSSLTSITGANVTGQVGNALVAGTVYTNAQPNITSVGTLTTLSVSGNANVGNIGATNGVFTNVSGNGSSLSSITGANVTGQVGNALVSGTVYTNAQPNITSVGTLTTLSVSGNANVGNMGTAGLITATGNITGGNLIGIFANGNSNIAIPAANGNINFSIGGQANEVIFTSTGANVNGYLSVSGNANIANIGTGGLISATGNITGGNLITSGLISATGALTASSYTASNSLVGYFLANTGTNVGKLFENGNIIKLEAIPSNYGVALAANGTVQLSFDANGYGAIGSSSGTTGYALRIAKQTTGATSAGSILINPTVQTDVTSTATGVRTSLSTAVGASPYTISNLVGYGAYGGTIGANTTVTNQIAYYVDSGVTGGANNWGFYGGLAAAATSYNLYMQGTANNYLGGTLGLGTTSLAGYGIHNGLTLSGAATVYADRADGAIANTVTSAAVYFATTSSTVAAATSQSLTTLIHYQAVQGTFNTNAAVTTQSAFVADNTLTGATNNYGFRGSIASGANRFNLYMDGSANNYIAGNFGIGNTAPTTNLAVTGTAYVSGNANIGNLGTAQVLASANITAPQLISNVAIGTAPLIVTSTTQVANLNVATAGTATSATSATNAAALLQNTSTSTTVYPTFTTSSANGNSQAVINTSISANLGNASITATTFVGALSGAATSATTAGTVTTNAQPNITSVGTLTSLSVSGNANIGNIGTAQVLASANITAPQLISNVAIGTAPLVVTSTTLVTNLYVARANVSDFSSVTTATTGNYYLNFVNALTGNLQEYANATFVANVANGAITATTFVGALSGAATTAGTVTTNAQPNITSVGTLTSLSVSGNITGANVIAANTFLANGANGTVVANNFTASGNATGNANVSTITGNLGIRAIFSTYTDNSAIASATIANAAIHAIAAPNLAAANATVTFTNAATFYIAGAPVANTNATITNPYALFVATGNSYFGGNVTFASNLIGTLANGTSNVNIPIVNGNINLSSAGNANIVVVTGTGINVAGTLNATGNANVGNIGAAQGIFTTSANIPLINSGTSNITLASGGNVSTLIGGNATAQLVVTATGANIPGTANIVGLVTGGNFTTTGANATVTANNLTLTGAASGNVNVAAALSNLGLRTVAATYTDTAVTGTQANGAIHYIAVPTITGGTNAKTYTNMATFHIAGPVTASTNATITTNYALFVASGNSFFGGNITASNIIGTFANGNSNVNIPAANGNINISAVGNANIFVVTGTGVNVTGSANIAGATIISGNASLPVSTGSNPVITGGLGTPNIGKLYIGDGTGWNFKFASRVGSTDTDRITFNDNGSVVFTAGLSGITTLSATGNANVGNIGTGIITSSGNVTGANIIATTYDITGVATGIAAAGTVQANATVIAKAINVVSTVATGAGVVFPVAVAGMRLTIMNTSANSLLVYPNTSGIINSLAANGAYTLTSSGRLDFVAVTTTQWYTLNATYG
jgi:hypothetical protein